jgi:hypothetical protein
VSVSSPPTRCLLENGFSLKMTASGRTYKAFWYVPEVRRWVKSVEEYYASSGVRNEKYTGELESFNLTP